MTTGDSLKQSMDNAVRHYGSLFKLPSYRKVLWLQVLVCVGTGVFSVFTLVSVYESLIYGLILGLLFFLVSLTCDYVLHVLVLSRDPIYDLRRASSVSLFSWGMWFLSITVGAILGSQFGQLWWFRLCLFGFSIAFISRLVIFKASLSINWWRLLTASFLQPFACLLLLLQLWMKLGHNITPNTLLFLVFSPTVGYISTHFFLLLLDRVGQQALAVPSLSLFRAFLLNWVADLNAPFEEFLERLGEEQVVEVSVVKFESDKPKAVIVVPSIHPGPFKNVGSSLLPSSIKNALEKKLSCVACVLLGLQGHELDLASQSQSQRVIDHVIKSLNFGATESKATPLIKASSGSASGCCQIFGNFAFLSLTLAPNTTEDLPQELGQLIRQESEKYGLTCCIIVNAHNSINGKACMPEALDALKNVAATCLEEAVSTTQLPFEIGAATVTPEEFSLRDGMGVGGITATVVRVDHQRIAYVVIDGNNMISGLREEILSAFSSVGIDEGEIFTTDTHSVSAVIVGERGYHPVGEAINHERLIAFIKEAILEASSRLEHVKAGCINIKVDRVKVIGRERLETLSLLTERVLQRAKRVVIPIFALTGVLLMLFLLSV